MSIASLGTAREVTLKKCAAAIAEVTTSGVSAGTDDSAPVERRKMSDHYRRTDAPHGDDVVLVRTTEHGGLLVPRSVVSGERAPSVEESVLNGEKGENTRSEVRPEDRELIQEPAKVLRIATMVEGLLDEVRGATLDEASRSRLKEIYDDSRRDLMDLLSPDLARELDRMALPFDTAAPSQAELRVAQAQLVGWLEGLFHGIQAAVFAQQLAARAQMGADTEPAGTNPSAVPDEDIPAPGPYL
jgi:Protein of unknown function (DUF2587)